MKFASAGGAESAPGDSDPSRECCLTRPSSIALDDRTCGMHDSFLTRQDTEAAARTFHLMCHCDTVMVANYGEREKTLELYQDKLRSLCRQTGADMEIQSKIPFTKLLDRLVRESQTEQATLITGNSTISYAPNRAITPFPPNRNISIYCSSTSYIEVQKRLVLLNHHIHNSHSSGVYF